MNDKTRSFMLKYDPRARQALLFGKREEVVARYVELYEEWLRSQGELYAAINYTRQTGNAPDFLQRKGG
jgi:hypothetical protein